MTKKARTSDEYANDAMELAKAELTSLNASIERAKDDCELFEEMLRKLEQERAVVAVESQKCKAELTKVQDKNKELGADSAQLKEGIHSSEQEIVQIGKEAELKCKELTLKTKETQEEYRKVRQQFRGLQQDLAKLHKEQDKAMRLEQSIEQLKLEVESHKRFIQQYETQEANRIQSLSNNAKALHNLSHAPPHP